METTYQPPDEYAHLYALRHEFRPNEMMIDQVGGLFQSGKAPDFSLLSTRDAYVDGLLYSLHKYRFEDDSVFEAMQKWHNTQFALGRMAVRQLPHKLQLAFMPDDQTSFFALVSSLDVYPDIFPHRQPIHHYLYANFSTNLLNDSYDTALHDIAATVRKGLFSASVQGVKHSVENIPRNKLRGGWHTGTD